MLQLRGGVPGAIMALSYSLLVQQRSGRWVVSRADAMILLVHARARPPCTRRTQRRTRLALHTRTVHQVRTPAAQHNT